MPDILGIPGDYRVGCILSVPVKTRVGTVHHKGLFADRLGPDDLPTVLHNSHLVGKVIESTMSDYVALAVGPLSSDGFPSQLAPHAVLERARSQLDQPWRLLNNCEHFVMWCHDMPVCSPQLRTATRRVGTAAAVAGAFVLRRLLLP
jgi:hypothetical protein